MLKSVIDRLQSLPEFKLVGGAANIPTAQDNSVVEPAAYVIPIREQAEDNSLITGLSQRVHVVFSVLIAIKNVSDMRGEAGVADLAVLRKSIKASLLNWPPATEYDPINFVSGVALGIDDFGVLWWSDEYKTSFYERLV